MIEIEKSKENMTNMYFFWKKKIVNDKRPIIRHHKSCHHEKDMVRLLKTRRKGMFGHQMVSHMPPTCWHVISTHLELFQIKKYFFNLK